MKRIWIISELFPPEETSTAFIMGEIANALSARYEVNVLAGPETYDKSRKFKGQGFKLDDNVKVTRAELPDFNKNSLSGKLLRFILLSRKFGKLLKANVKPEDKVLIVTNPAPLLVIVGKLHRKVGFDFSILVHDVFPENTRAAGIKLPKLAYSRLKSVFDKAYAEADSLIALGRDMKSLLRDKACKGDNPSSIRIIENWADIDIIDAEYRDSGDEITIQFAGNLGRVQGLDEFLSIYREADNPNVKLELWGSGAFEGKLKEMVEKNAIQGVTFKGPYPRAAQSDVLNSCDLAIVTLAKGMYGLGVPSKSYNIMAAGKPILFIGDPESEIALTVKENRIGYVFDINEREKAIEFLRSLTLKDKEELRRMGKRSRELAEKKYGKDIILKKFLDI
ncbi:MAG: glycosyltransferase family 4 protein [Clostridiales bacterium]|nr:glycosyltransferase family 4 protein [Clostridiales bacterium]